MQIAVGVFASRDLATTNLGRVLRRLRERVRLGTSVLVDELIQRVGVV